MCSLCGKEIRYKHTPTHLSQHLRTCHEKETSNNVDKNDQPRLDHFVKHVKTKSPIKYQVKHPKQKEFRKTLVEWIIDSNRPCKAVEYEKLMEAFLIADPKLKG